MSYKHGIYGNTVATNNATDVSQGTIPCYIGSAPVHRIGATNVADYVNKPFLVSTLREAKEMGLYSDDWNTYTLGEVLHAHFMNGSQQVAPIILINVMDPATAVAEKAHTATVSMRKSGTKFVGSIKDPLCILSDVALTAEGQGITVTNVKHGYDGDTVTFEAEATATVSSFNATVTYKRVEFDSEMFDEVSVQKALDSLDYCEQITGYIPNILAAPVISEDPAHNALMVQKAMERISGKWHFAVLSDIPATVATYAEAQTWKHANAYDSKFNKVFWPKVAHGDKVYHLSVIGAYMMQMTDMQNSDVPYISISNKPIFCDRAVANGETLMISEANANGLNQVGITTVNMVKRGLRLWGAHMANYNYAALGNIAAEDRFDSSVRMMMYLLNHMQYQYINEIDQSFTRKDIDAVVNGVQTWLDSLVNDGMLLFAEISFNNESNSDADIANGDFTFDMEVTYAVCAKSITFKLAYTSTGLVNLTTAGGDE